MSNPKKRKKMSGTVSRHKGHQLPTRVSAEVYELLQARAREEERTVAQSVRLLIEKVLRAEGRLPPASGGQH
jgi:hypothetical protein